MKKVYPNFNNQPSSNQKYTLKNNNSPDIKNNNINSL